MTNEEKILNILSGVQSGMQEMRGDMAGMRDDITGIRGDITGIRGDIVELRGEMNARFEAVDKRFETVDNRFEAMDNRFETMDNRMLRLEFKIETDIETKLDALGDGHAAIIEQLTPRTRVDELESRVKFLEVMLRQMSEELQNLKAV